MHYLQFLECGGKRCKEGPGQMGMVSQLDGALLAKSHQLFVELPGDA